MKHIFIIIMAAVIRIIITIIIITINIYLRIRDPLKYTTFLPELKYTYEIN